MQACQEFSWVRSLAVFGCRLGNWPAVRRAARRWAVNLADQWVG